MNIQCGVSKVKWDIKFIIVKKDTLKQDIANNLPGSPHISPEGEPSDDEEIPGVHCDEEEEGNLNATAQFLLLGNNQQVKATDGYPQQKFT